MQIRSRLNRLGEITHPPSRWDIFPVLLPDGNSSALTPSGDHAVAACRLHAKVVPSHQMRCRMTASFRAVATAAFLKPLRAASRTAQAFSGENRFTLVIRLDAASTRSVRMAASPHLEIRPKWSTSPDWYRLGVSPR